jgi:hypothetical protein
MLEIAEIEHKLKMELLHFKKKNNILRPKFENLKKLMETTTQIRVKIMLRYGSHSISKNQYCKILVYIIVDCLKEIYIYIYIPFPVFIFC